MDAVRELPDFGRAAPTRLGTLSYAGTVVATLTSMIDKIRDRVDH
jgi:hypothetical protein